MKHTAGKTAKRVGTVLLVLTLALVAMGPMMTQAQAADATSSATVPQGGGSNSKQTTPKSTGGSRTSSNQQAPGGDLGLAVDTSS